MFWVTYSHILCLLLSLPWKYRTPSPNSSWGSRSSRKSEGQVRFLIFKISNQSHRILKRWSAHWKSNDKKGNDYIFYYTLMFIFSLICFTETYSGHNVKHPFFFQWPFFSPLNFKHSLLKCKDLVYKLHFILQSLVSYFILMLSPISVWNL